eukprot:TRINITY_DN4610_c0_g1_i2.p1 TRINITY_DN4610_c0_g1~~TRINITY_DN4610_c0_g1_i2.p1  ORF type:complete len:308 (+),score=45.63 TRINITY_DN4610_c0_g1_i2:139-924(+)
MLNSPSKSVSPLHFIENSENQWNYYISLPVMTLDTNGKFIFPPAVKRIWFDVGAHKESMMCRPSLETQDDLGIIAFEPMYDKWGHLFIQNRHERLFSIPAAVGTEEGWGLFRIAATDMCSSLKGVDPNANRKDWPGGCTETKFEVKVPIVRLETIINLLPPDMYVEFLKIDAQGADWEVVSSAGNLLSRVNMVVVEVQVNKPLYHEAHTEEEYVELFKRHGFEIVRKQLQAKYEENILFHNMRYPIPEEGVLPLKKIFKDV